MQLLYKIFRIFFKLLRLLEIIKKNFQYFALKAFLIVFICNFIFLY